MFIKKTSKYFEVRVENGKIVLIRVIPAKISLETIRQKIKKKGLTEKEIEEAIKWMREKD
jgi:SOS response regulatory protein OraA/RecX